MFIQQYKEVGRGIDNAEEDETTVTTCNKEGVWLGEWPIREEVFYHDVSIEVVLGFF